MSLKEKISSRAAIGLRTRYFPKNRIGQGLVSVAPWFDIALLIICFLLLKSNVVLQPGVVIDLPTAKFTQGFHSQMVAVVSSVEDGQDGDRKEVVYFNDERFVVRIDDQMTQLQVRMAKELSQKYYAGLIIQADSHVSHGTLLKIINVAQEIGVDKVNIATKPL